MSKRWTQPRSPVNPLEGTTLREFTAERRKYQELLGGFALI